MKRNLANQHHLACKVHLDQSRYHRDTNRADIVIDARPGPVVKVRVAGAKLSWLPFLRGRQMQKLIPIFSEGTVDPDLVEEGKRNLVDFFQSKGYFDAKVTTNFQTQVSNVDLVYNVDRGSRHKVETVAFRGNLHGLFETEFAGCGSNGSWILHGLDGKRRVGTRLLEMGFVR
jgi:outer membrane protein assembly factor BamA